MKRFLLIYCILLAPVFTFAQRRALTVSTGYQWALNTKTSELTNGHQPASFSLGTGTIVNASWMTELDSHWVADMGVSFLSGSRSLSAKTDSTGPGRWGYTTLAAAMLQAKLTIGYQIYIKHTQVYFNLGLLLPLAGRIREEGYINDSNRVTRYEALVRNKPGVGFTSAIGARFRLTDKVSFFTALQGNLLNLRMNSRRLTGYSDYKNRSLETAYPSVYDREIHYVNNLDGPINDKTVNPKGTDMGKPRETITSKNPYSSIGLNFGLVLYF